MNPRRRLRLRTQKKARSFLSKTLRIRTDVAREVIQARSSKPFDRAELRKAADRTVTSITATSAVARMRGTATRMFIENGSPDRYRPAYGRSAKEKA